MGGRTLHFEQTGTGTASLSLSVSLSHSPSPPFSFSPPHPIRLPKCLPTRILTHVCRCRATPQSEMVDVLTTSDRCWECTPDQLETLNPKPETRNNPVSGRATWKCGCRGGDRLSMPWCAKPQTPNPKTQRSRRSVSRLWHCTEYGKLGGSISWAG